MSMTSAQRTAATKEWRARERKVYLKILEHHLMHQEKLRGISPDAAPTYERLDAYRADWRRKIFSVMDWWVRTQDLLIDIDGLTVGSSSAAAADRRRRLKPATAALHELMSALGPALTGNTKSTSNAESISEMVRLFGLYTLSVREYANTVLPGLDLDAAIVRESARVQLQAIADDLEVKIAARTADKFTVWYEKAVLDARVALRNSSTTPVATLLFEQKDISACTKHLEAHDAIFRSGPSCQALA